MSGKSRVGDAPPSPHSGKGSGAGEGLTYIAFSSSALCSWDPSLSIPFPKAERR